ncbi:hypothetical protein CEXT_696911 [Caerostris extrusa]|uniref:Uncharacterized protein n=1 Tax=Caerostris extrusa TaxID=172846 RepID=A0AAV4QVT7_CAEEX|nr:hypothetical protein CEXT_696911 [Caerostris extrusa]
MVKGGEFFNTVGSHNIFLTRKSCIKSRKLKKSCQLINLGVLVSKSPFRVPHHVLGVNISLPSERELFLNVRLNDILNENVFGGIFNTSCKNIAIFHTRTNLFLGWQHDNLG